jgi:hypothetical protein
MVSIALWCLLNSAAQPEAVVPVSAVREAVGLQGALRPGHHDHVDVAADELRNV